MKLDFTPKGKDKIQIEKKQTEVKLYLEKRLQPHPNHKTFQFNTKSNKLTFAVFDEKPIIKWNDAVDKNYGVYRKITRKDNCLYFSALNLKNAIKVLKRDYNIIHKTI